jgi:hypothetical protein
MTRRNPLVALLLSLCLMLGAVTEAVGQTEMAGMSDLVVCGAAGQITVTLDASGRPVPRHPCTHCLAAGGLALPVITLMPKPPALLAATVQQPEIARWRPLTSRYAPSARDPPVFSV